MRNKSLVFGAVLALVSSAGIAVATAASDRRDVIHGCRDRDTGALRVIDDDESCRSSEEALDWNTSAQPARRWYADRDGDKYGDWYDSLDSVVLPPGYVADNTDCNDDRQDVNPGTGVSIGKGQDFDCDGIANERAIRWYRDRDEDGWGSGREFISDRPARPEGYVMYPHDCDDNNFRVQQECYAHYTTSFDQDGDGHNVIGMGPEGRGGYDCNDSNREMHPGADEIPYDGLDNDCGFKLTANDTPDVECYTEHVGRHDPKRWGWRVPDWPYRPTACHTPVREAPQPSKKKASPRPSPTPTQPPRKLSDDRNR